MQPRSTLVQIFSTFAQFEADCFSYWATSIRLRRSIQRVKTKVEEESEEFWVLHWHQHWQHQSQLPQDLPGDVSYEHLAAYVQEVCYWSAYRVTTRPRHDGLADCFQMAIVTLPKVLKGYRAEQGASLKTYAFLSFSNTIRDRLRHQQECSCRTDWGLLRKVSQKCLTESLKAAGLTNEMIDRYRLAWIGFKRFYLPNTTALRQLAAPDAETWRAIADFYNCQQLATVDPTTIEDWLRGCVKTIRAYLSPPITSLNVQKFEDGTGDVQDDLPDLTDAPLEVLISQEELRSRQEQKAQIEQILMTALETLDPEHQMLLKLYYQRGMTQQQIAQQLDMKQYTISRRLSKVKETLLKAIAHWSQTTLHISLTSPAVQQMSLVLEEWLQAHDWDRFN